MGIQHDKLADLLAAHLSAPNRLVWCDMQLGPAGSPRPDVYTLEKSYANPSPRAFEVKVNRSDFLADITAGKWQRYLTYAQSVTFCFPQGLATKEEVPTGCGLIVFYPETGAFKTLRRPTLQKEYNIPQDAFLKMVIDGVQRAQNFRRNEVAQQLKRNANLNKKVGEDVALFIANKSAAESRLEVAENALKMSLLRQKNIDEECKKKVDKALDLARSRAKRIEDDAEKYMAQLRSILGLAESATVWEVQRAVSDLRDGWNSCKQVEHLTKVINRISGEINRSAEHFATEHNTVK